MDGGREGSRVASGSRRRERVIRMTSTTGHRTALAAPQPVTGSRFPVLGIDHIELYVGNSHQAAWAYERLGFRIDGYAGPHTGQRDRVSWFLSQHGVRLVVTGATSSGSAVADHVRRHGDGVKDIAFGVPDAAAAFGRALAAGATPVCEPFRYSDVDGAVVRGTVAAYGDVVHSLVSRSGAQPYGLPGFLPVRGRPPVSAVGVLDIDHVVAAVPAGRGGDLVDFYREVMDFEPPAPAGPAGATRCSTRMTKVTADGCGRVTVPVVEPPRGRRSQIQEFLDVHEGPGVQHLALATGDIVATVEALRRAGLDFLDAPDTYFDEVARWVGAVSGRVPALRRNGILADRDDGGYLLQIFARPTHDRHTLFLELIERHGATGLGEGNIRALSEALERERDARGTR